MNDTTALEARLASEAEALRAKLADVTADRDMLDKHAKHMLDWRDAQDKTIEGLRGAVARLRACIAEVEADCAHVADLKGAAPWRKRQADRTSAILYRHGALKEPTK